MSRLDRRSAHLPASGGQDDDDGGHAVERRLDGSHCRAARDICRLGRQHPQLLEQLTMMDG